MKVTRCEGHGLGSCTRCEEKGIWNRHWTSMLNEIEGKEGCYCDDCVNVLKESEERLVTRQNYIRQFGDDWH